MRHAPLTFRAPHCVAIACGVPADNIIVRWSRDNATLDLTLHIVNSDTKARLEITQFRDDPTMYDSDSLGELFKYTTQPGQTVSMTQDIAEKTIQFLKETA